MTLMKDAGPDSVKLFQRCKIDLIDDGVEEEVEMLKTFKASIDEVRRGDGEKIIDFRLERVQEVRGVSGGDCRDFCAISSNLKDVFIVE